MYKFCILMFLLGVYFLLVYNLHECSTAARNAVKQNKKQGFSNKRRLCITYLERKIEPFIKLSETKGENYSRMLQTLEIQQTPKQYIAHAIAESTLFAIGGTLPAVLLMIVPVSLLSEQALRLRFASPMLALLGLCFGFYVYANSQGKLKRQYEHYRIEVELDLPKLCSVINSRLRMSGNVQEILTSYLPVANKAMAAELKLTLEDMKTGSKEVALRRLESRVSSPRVSDVVRGLISVLNGDDQRAFFQNKQQQFNNDFVTIKKKELKNRNSKLWTPTAIVFLFFFLLLLYPMVMTIGNLISDFT